MDKKRTLKITHPHLRRVRNALRSVIVDAVYDKMDEIRKEKSNYSPDKVAIRSSLSDQYGKLKRALDASICKCAKCASIDSDMIHNPYNNKWYCIWCYEKAHEWYKTHPNSTESRNAPNPFP